MLDIIYTIAICTIIFLLGAVFGDITGIYTFDEYMETFIDITIFVLAGLGAFVLLALFVEEA